MARALLVCRDLAVGAPIADELERRGFELSWCPGPQEPTFVCIAGKGKACPIATDNDVVVLDGWLGPDEARKGMPSWHLLLYYHSIGLPAVFLVGPDAPPGQPPDESVVFLRRDLSAADVADAVESVLVRAGSVSYTA